MLQVDNNQMSGTLTAGLAKLPLLNTLCATQEPAPHACPPCTHGSLSSALSALLCSQSATNRPAELSPFSTNPRSTITGNKFRTWDLNFNCSWPGPSATFACSGNTFSCWPSTFCPALLTTIQALDGSCAVACPPPPGPPPVGRRMMAVAE